MDLDRTVEEITNRLDILSVVGRYVRLKKAGRNYLGLCPFHAERTPSFTVSPDKQMYYCFGCKSGGNVVSFVSKLEGLSYREALEQLAREAGIDLPEFKRGPDRSSDYEILDFAQEFFEGQLPKSAVSQDYLNRRGVSKDMLRKFQIGYAPTDAGILPRLLEQKGLGLVKAQTLGVISKGSDGHPYSYMRGRVTFPILDERGRVIAFGGRVLDDGEIKYLNSPNTPLFEKGKTFFAYHLARSTIAKIGRAIVVEGYMDTVSMHQAGFMETIATLGTAFTLDHAMKLRKLGADVYLFYDHDDAGSKAALSAVKTCFQAGLACKVVRQDVGKDPDDLAKQGKEAVEKTIQSALDPIEFAFSYLSSLEKEPASPVGKSRLLKALLEIVEASPDAVVKNQYKAMAAKLLGLERWLLEKPFDNKQKVTVKNTKSKLTISNTRLLFETRIIKAIVNDKDARGLIISKLVPEYFSDPLCKKVTSLMLANQLDFDNIKQSALNGAIDDEIMSFLAKVEIDDADEDMESFVDDVCLELDKIYLEGLKKKAEQGILTKEEMAEYLSLQRKRTRVQKEEDGRGR